MRVLIIEDDPAIATNLYDYLEAHSHSVDAAGDGITGLHLAITQKFDGILLDLNLPGMGRRHLVPKAGARKRITIRRF